MLPTIFIAFGACFVLERLVPGWRLPHVRTWPLRVLAINAVQLGGVVLAGFTWERWLSAGSLFHLSRHLGPAAGGLVAYFIATFVFYWWHRARHESDLLWRLFHQIHHSPQRIEVITSFYKHPVEMVVNSIIGSLLVYAVLGLSPAAGAVYTLCTALGELVRCSPGATCTAPTARDAGQAAKPPSTARSDPVTKLASGLASHATIDATSSGRPWRGRAMKPCSDLPKSVSAGFMSVSTGPGSTLLTVMPRGPRSRARPLTRPVRADLLIA
jgi:hypothetical protein